MVLTGVLSLLVVVVIRTASIAIDLGETGYYDEPLARLVLGARLLSEMDDDHYKEDTFFVGVETQVPLPALRRPTRKVEVLG